MPKLLTKRKQKWMAERKRAVIKGGTLTPSAAVAARYYERLDSLIEKMSAETERRIKSLFSGETADDYFAQDDSISSQARILTNALIRKFNSAFAVRSKDMAETFANQSNDASSAQVHSAMMELSGGLSLPTTSLEGQLSEMMSAIVTENVSLIKSIPQQYFTQIQGQVMRSITTGNGLQDLIPFMEKHKQITKRRARMIATDQTRKAMNSLSRGRLQNLGMKKFEWIHTGGSNEPRQEHIAMSGKIYSFDDPPVIDKKTGAKGFPGDAINCRCRMKLVLDLEDSVAE